MGNIVFGLCIKSTAQDRRVCDTDTAFCGGCVKNPMIVCDPAGNVVIRNNRLDDSFMPSMTAPMGLVADYRGDHPRPTTFV